MALIDAKRGRKKPPSLRVKFDGDAHVNFADQASIADDLYGVDEASVDLKQLVVDAGLLDDLPNQSFDNSKS